MSKIDEILKQYEWDSIHVESLSFCPGYGGYLDLSQFDEHEIIRSEAYDTYCVKYFCGGKYDCKLCEKLNDAESKKEWNITRE